MIRWFGPFLASRYSGKIFINRTGTVEVASVPSCSANERGFMADAVRWIWDAQS